jgi:hypothetical protein
MTNTDADHIHQARGGPFRPVHAQPEAGSAEDLDRAARLLAAFARGLKSDAGFAPR